MTDESSVSSAAQTGSVSKSDQTNNLLDAFGSNEYDIDCIYSFCDASLRDPEERLRHMVDCHGHSWESAHKSVQEAGADV